jgi:membrane protein
MVALITAMNVAYNEHERRGFFHRLALSLLFTIIGVIGFVMVVLLGIAVPVLVGLLPLGVAGEWVLLSVRWALLWLVAVLALSALYRFAPIAVRLSGIGSVKDQALQRPYGWS